MYEIIKAELVDYEGVRKDVNIIKNYPYFQRCDSVNINELEEKWFKILSEKYNDGVHIWTGVIIKRKYL